MSKTVSKFALAAGFVLAITFTFSCSSDDDGGGGGSPSSSSVGMQGGVPDLPKQVYFWGEEYDGNVNIAVLISKYGRVGCGGGSDGGVACTCTSDDGIEFSCKEEDVYDTLPAGKIQNGQLSLNLPTINSKYLRKFEPCNDEYCQSNISVVPRNLTFTEPSLYAPIPGIRGLIRPYRTKSDKTDRAQFYYFSESGSITGTETDTYHGYQTNFDMNFSKGWNLVYYDTYGKNSNLTTDLPKDGTWEWWIE